MCNVHAIAQVMLKDHNSKYGTRINKTKIEPLSEIPLHRGDGVSFGQGREMR